VVLGAHVTSHNALGFCVIDSDGLRPGSFAGLRDRATNATGSTRHEDAVPHQDARDRVVYERLRRVGQASHPSRSRPMLRLPAGVVLSPWTFGATASM